MITFDKIVKKLLKKWWKIIFKEDIFEIIDPEKKTEYESLLNKILYRLKAEWIIKMIRNWVYIVPEKWDVDLNEIDLIEKYYYGFVKKYITQYVWSEYFISGKKALEVHMKNYSIPERLVVVNRKLNKKVLLWQYQIQFKTIGNSQKNLYQSFSKLTKSVPLEGINFKISNLELALVESCMISDESEWISLDLISKSLKKYGKFLDKEHFYTIGELKYIMAFNRLKELSKPIDTKLYEIFLDVIKKNGWLFIWEGLRKVI